MVNKQRKQFLFASDFDQTLTFNDTGYVLSELLGISVKEFERKAKGPLGMKVPHESGACAQCHNGQKRSDGMPSAFAANTRCLSCHQSPVTPP